MIDLPFWDPNPRRALDDLIKTTKEEDILNSTHVDGEVLTSPKTLALTIMLLAKNRCEKFQKENQILETHNELMQRIFLEFLSLFYYLIGQNISAYFADSKQFTLFVMKTHVEILNNLQTHESFIFFYPDSRFLDDNKIQEVEKIVSTTILDGENFYIRNKLKPDEVLEIENIKSFTGMEKVYSDNFLSQVIVKSFYRILQITGIDRRDVKITLPLYNLHASYLIEVQKTLISKIRPCWRQNQA